MNNKLIKIIKIILLLLAAAFIIFAVFYYFSNYRPNNSAKKSAEKKPATNQQVNDAQSNGYEFTQLANKLIDEKCVENTNNVYMTECAIELLDRTAAEREWKQRKLEAIKHPQINTYDMVNILEEEQLKIRNWREGFEKMRDDWCNAKSNFVTGSGITQDIARCQLEFELLAINDVNNLYYENIMKNVYDSQGIADFEPTKANIDELIKTNATKRGCVWAGEENCENATSTIEQSTQVNNIVKEDGPIDLKTHVKNGEKVEIIKINNGINKIDLNNDGIMDMVFMAERENGSSSHWYSTYTFAIYAPQLPIFGSDSKESYWHLVITWKGYKDDSQDETFYYDRLATVEGADGMLQDTRLIKSKNKKLVLLIARREFGETYADSQIVRFHFYDLVENSQADDWSSNYSYEYRDTATTDSTYTDVNEAISKELINKY